MDALRQKLLSLEDEAEELASAYEEAERKIAKQDTKIAALETIIAKQDARLSSLEADLDSLTFNVHFDKSSLRKLFQ